MLCIKQKSDNVHTCKLFNSRKLENRCGEGLGLWDLSINKRLGVRTRY